MTIPAHRDVDPDLHDRYALDDRGLLLIGHGLKDAGKRESFGIMLDVSTFADVVADVRQAFDARWAAATAF